MGQGCEWRHARKRWAGNFGDFWKGSELTFEPGRGQLRFEPGRGQSSWGLRDTPRVCWVRWNGQHSVSDGTVRLCVSLYLLMSKDLIQEVNDRFGPELPRVASVSGFHMHMNILCIRIMAILPKYKSIKMFILTIA